MSELIEFNNKHEDETIFIFGNGEELHYLTDEQKIKLNKKTTIGTNYSHMAYTPKYLISGHFSHFLYAYNFANIDKIDRMFFQGDRDNIQEYDDVMKKTTLVNIKYLFNNLGLKIHKDITEQNNYLVGASNVGISSSNLAYIMGAKKIVYIGFNQRNNLHFYNLDDNMKVILRENINKSKKKYENKTRRDEFNRDFNNLLKMLDIAPEQLAKTVYYKPDTTSAINVLFETLKQNGVEVISATKNSKFVDCGASYVDLDEIL